MQIKQINQNQLEECLEVIHKSFATVTKQFGFTQENCPGHTSFMPLEKLQRFYDWGFLMYGLFDDSNSKNQDKICGFISLSKVPERENVVSIHNLCVLPELRNKGYGKLLLDFAKEKSKELSAEILFVDFIEEHTQLKNWYIKNGFSHTGTEKYDHLPFTVGKAEYKLDIYLW